MPSNSRKHAFAEAVSIDAWHKPFGQTSKVDLHVDVVFGTARLGGEADSPVRFRLNIKRAELILVIPDSEPVEVDKDSVARDTPKVATIRKSKKVQNSANVGAGGATGGNLSGQLSATAHLNPSAIVKTSITETVESTREIETFKVTQSKSADGSYRWLIEATQETFLDGRPWDSQKQPRLKLIDKRKDKTRSLPPMVLVEIKCRREDILIEDIALKDEPSWSLAQATKGFKNRVVAAESYLRDRLMKEGLEVENIGDVFGKLTLASIMAETS